MTERPDRRTLLRRCPRCGADPSALIGGVSIRDERIVLRRTDRQRQSPGTLVGVTLTHVCIKHQGVIETLTTIKARTFETAADEWNRLFAPTA